MLALTLDALPARIANQIMPVTESGCWLWLGSGVKGYGRTKMGGKKVLVHRLVYTIIIAPIPDEIPLDHLCRVRCCCNPAHLEPVTFKENVLRGIGPTAINSRKQHCDRGHEFTEQNTYRTKTGGRVCRACDREKYQEDKAAVLDQRRDYYRRNAEKVKARMQAYRDRKRASHETH